MNIKTILPLLAALILAGCTGINQGYVISATGTVIGMEVAQNPANQMYHAKLGYVRSELALVPTNKGTKDVPARKRGAKDTANVLMEMRFNGIFSLNGGIYQRLAVGDIAVAQQGAAIMFAKDADGKINTNLIQHIKSIPLAP